MIQDSYSFHEHIMYIVIYNPNTKGYFNLVSHYLSFAEILEEIKSQFKMTNYNIVQVLAISEEDYEALCQNKVTFSEIS